MIPGRSWSAREYRQQTGFPLRLFGFARQSGKALKDCRSNLAAHGRHVQAHCVRSNVFTPACIKRRSWKSVRTATLVALYLAPIERDSFQTLRDKLPRLGAGGASRKTRQVVRIRG